MKSELGLRPIYHQVEQRVEAHILVAFLAYCLTVTLRQRLQALAPGLTPKAVLEKLAAIQMLNVCFPTTDGRWLIMPRYTQSHAGTANPAAHAEARSACPAPSENQSSRRERDRPTAPFVGQTFSMPLLKSKELVCA